MIPSHYERQGCDPKAWPPRAFEVIRLMRSQGFKWNEIAAVFGSTWHGARNFYLGCAGRLGHPANSRIVLRKILAIAERTFAEQRT